MLEKTISKLKQLAAALPAQRDQISAIVHGFVGDTLEHTMQPWSIKMHFRTLEQELPLRTRALYTHLPKASSKICIMVHGVMANESIWRFPDDPAKTYGSLLRDQFGITPIYLRYNSGRHISTNAQEFVERLDRLISCWPKPVAEISLIGHSMGGLLLRSACHYAHQHNLHWLDKISRLVLLGVPNRGAGLEKFVNLASLTLNTIINPWTQLIGKTLDLRSDGIQDLRFGNLLDEDWQAQIPGQCWPGQHHALQQNDRIKRFVGVGSLLADKNHAVAQIVGDAMVSQPSARDATSREGSRTSNTKVVVFPKISHFSLVNNPEVYEQFRSWWCQN